MPNGASHKQPLRILFVQTQAEMAGAQEISRLLGQELSSPSNDGTPALEIHHLFLYRKTAGCDHFPNVHFVARERPSGVLGAARFVCRLFTVMRELRPDVVLPFQHYGNIVAAPVARLMGVPRIIANHVSAPATISRPVRLIDRVLGLSGFYDVITVNSHATWRDYQSYPGRYTRRIVHVPHGFAQRISTLDRSASRARFGLPLDAAIIGTVARLHPLKRIDLAIATLPLLPQVHLAIAGQGPDEERLRACALEYGVGQRVHFVGEMDGSGVADFLVGLDQFVFPSAAETFGLAAVEAAQAGLPVVAHDLPVLREVLDVDGKPCAHFVDAADTGAFAAAIQQNFDNPAQAAAMGALGRRLAERYSLSAMVDAYRDLIFSKSLPATSSDALHRPHLASSGP